MIEVKKLEYPFYHEDKTIIPGNDEVWELFVRIRTRYDESVEAIRELQKRVKEQDLEIQKLKLDKNNRVQKIEIIGFLGETSIPKQSKPNKYEKQL